MKPLIEHLCEHPRRKRLAKTVVLNAWMLLFALMWYLRGSENFAEGIWLLRLSDYRTEEQVSLRDITLAKDGLLALIGCIFFPAAYALSLWVAWQQKDPETAPAAKREQEK